MMAEIVEVVDMKPKQARKLRDILMIVGLVVMLMGYIHKAFLVVGACIAVSCLIPHFYFTDVRIVGNFCAGYRRGGWPPTGRSPA